MPNLRLAIVQTNPTVGAISSNLNRCFEQVAEAAKAGANLVLFPEMVVTGYPIEDLATRRSFVSLAEQSVAGFATRLADAGFGAITVVLGHPAIASNPNNWAISHNRASVLRDGRILHSYDKHHLPNYGVFDEFRNFVPADQLLTFDCHGLKLSVVICEDIWQTGGPVAQIAQSSTDLTLVLNGSPFEADKDDRRLALVTDLAKRTNSAVAYCNLVGGQDDLVFDGDSLFTTADGKLVGRGPQFVEGILLIDVESKDSAQLVSGNPENEVQTNLDNNWQIWNAIVLGLRDYVEKNGFSSVILGLSGGIDSAVCAALAVDAIGANRVFGVSMPSEYSSDHSKSDAHDLARRLGVSIREVPISQGVNLFGSQLGLSGLAEENLQARLRGLILMSLSNKEGHLVLTTGNKTELAVGYSTIYGDSVGGFAPIKDVAKTLVWQLARWRNSFAVQSGQEAPIPENSISKPPSAELRPGQLDQDSLPDYELLDQILELYIEARLGQDELIERGFEPELVQKISKLVSTAEWKRRQGAIGPKISSMSYGRDRRMPITNKFK